MRSLRRVLIAALAWALLVPAAASAQDAEPTPPAVFEELGTDFDTVDAAVANAAWDDLGLFSNDVNRLLTATAQPTDASFYGFGDDPNGAPLFDAVGAAPAARGAMAIQIPDDWTPPAEGLAADLAFAQSTGSRLQPGDVALFMWMEFTDAYDFDPAQQINEGFPLTIPGLPVWNSSFAGDTWEGANLIPNAVYDGTTLTFDVKSYAPPQSFPLVDVPGFYYRSGNVMAMAVGTEAIEAYATEQGVTVESALGSAADDAKSLATSVGAAVIPAQSQDPLGDFVFTTTLFTAIVITWYVHLSRNGLFTPGLIGVVTAYAMLTTLIMLARAVFTGPLPVEVLTDEPEGDPEDTPSEDVVTDAPTDEDTTGGDTTDGTDDTDAAPATDVTQETGETAADDSGSSVVWILIIIIGLGIVAVGFAVTRTRRGGSKRVGSDDRMSMTLDPRDGVPGLVPPEDDDPPAERCGYEVKFWDGDTADWYDVRALQRGETACCVYKIKIESTVIFDQALASIRQDAPAERLAIPTYEQQTRGLDWVGLTGTRSGPAGRQDWQHGDGDPIDTSGGGDPLDYWQGAQGEERPDVTCHTFHFEMTTVKAWLESGCVGHRNEFDTTADLDFDVVVSQECTNDDPGPACPVELNAFGGTVAMAIGDVRLNSSYANGTDIDELERHATAYAEMSEAERGRYTAPAVPVTGTWDGHDHETLDKATFPFNDVDSSGKTEYADSWEASFFTLSVSLNGQLVPVSTWPTTERVSTAMHVHPKWSLALAANLETLECYDGACSGHPDRECHDDAGFRMKLEASDLTIEAGDDTVELERPPAPRAADNNPTVQPGVYAWKVGSHTQSGGPALGQTLSAPPPPTFATGRQGVKDPRRCFAPFDRRSASVGSG